MRPTIFLMRLPLTQGVIQLDAAVDSEGQASARVLQNAYLNSRLQTGLPNLLDEAVMARAEKDKLPNENYRKLAEIPYDFVRKRLSIVVSGEQEDTLFMITKGALQNVLDVCNRVERQGRFEPLDAAALAQIHTRFAQWSEKGFRVLGLAHKHLTIGSGYSRQDEAGMVFDGFLLFLDPPELGVQEILHALQRLGVRLKIITGDNHLVARHVAEVVGMKVKRLVTGSELTSIRDEALWHLAPEDSVFAEVDPNQKERIIRALQKSGHVVGYLGDGINDAPALHAADVGISVDKAVDVAKEAADFVLLRHDLNVVRQGIDEGRHTFANTLKYIFITTSANFGNMISMALGSLFLPFLPMLAKQILLNNFLSDIPAMSIAGDNVDHKWERTPHRWDIRFMRNFMITFGLMSTAFDIITFVALLYLVGKSPELFRTGWFVESLLTELCIIFIIRTYKPFFHSHPSHMLTGLAFAVGIMTLVLPYLPLAAVFGFCPLPPPVLVLILIITALYILVSELTKQSFYRRFV